MKPLIAAILFGLFGLFAIVFLLYKRKKHGDAVMAADNIDPQQIVDRDIEYLKEALGAFGKQLDFSVQSIRALDTWLDEHVHHGQPKEPLKTHFLNKVICLGAYLGETIRRQVNAGTYALGSIEKLELILQLPDGTVLLPAQRVLKRIQYGEEESLFAYLYGVLSQQPASGAFQSAQA